MHSLAALQVEGTNRNPVLFLPPINFFPSHPPPRMPVKQAGLLGAQKWITCIF